MKLDRWTLPLPQPLTEKHRSRVLLGAISFLTGVHIIFALVGLTSAVALRWLTPVWLLLIGGLAIWLLRNGRSPIAAHLFFINYTLASLGLWWLGAADELITSLLLSLPILILPLATSLRQALPYLLIILLFFATRQSELGWLFLITSVGLMGMSWFASVSQHATLNSYDEMQAETLRLQRSFQTAVAEQTNLLNERVQRLQTGLDIGQAVSGALFLKQLLNKATSLIHTRYDLESAAVLLRDVPQQPVFSLASIHPALPAGHDQPTSGLQFENATPAGRTLENGRWARETGNPAHFSLSLQEYVELNAELCLPLKARGQLIGLLLLHTADPERFSDVYNADLQLLADQLAIHIDNAHYFSQAERQAQSLVELQTITDLMIQQATSHSALNVLAQRVRELTSASGAGIFIWRPEIERLVLVLNLDLGADMDAQQIQLGEGLAGRSFGENHTLIIDDYENWEGRLDQIDTSGIYTVLATPLRQQQTPVGVLVLSQRRPNTPFLPDQVRMVELLAAQAGTILMNQQLLDETQYLARRERMVNDITARVRRSLDTETILEAAASQLGDALGNRSIRVRLFPTNDETELAAPPTDTPQAD